MRGFAHLRLLLAWGLGSLLLILGFGVGLRAPADRTGQVEPIVVRHALWDSAQKSMYQQCANDFERANPNVRIRIQQSGWDEYWSALSTGFVAGTAPDVFTNHLTKFADQVSNGVLLDLAPLIANDNVRTDIYEDQLLANWSREGRPYALPADWDTVALVVNLEMVKQAGISEEELRGMTWNPHDGGSFGRIAAKLTKDRGGRSPFEPGFDRRQVAVHGYQTPGSGGLFGQTEWSHFAVSAGFRFQDSPWRGPLRYDDEALIQTLDWIRSLAVQGISATPEAMGRLGTDAMFVSGRVAMVPTGSWMIGHFTRNARFAHVYVPLPIGPAGFRATMLNGLGHSIWSGTRHRDAAWRWVRHLGSAECQALVAGLGIVYPAVRGLADVSAQAQRRAGARPEAFLEMARAKTYAPPIIDRSAQLEGLIDPAIEQVLLGRLSVRSAMVEANDKANRLLYR